MILSDKVHRLRLNGVGEGERSIVGAEGTHSRRIPYVAYYRSYALRNPPIETLHLVLFNLHRTPIEHRAKRVPGQLDDPQRSPLPFLSLQTPRFRALQTVHRPVLHTFHVFLQRLPPLHGRPGATTPRLPAPTCRGRREDGKIYDLERVEIWERFAHDD